MASSSDSIQDILRKLPKMDRLLAEMPDEIPHGVKLSACRYMLETLRSQALAGKVVDIPPLDELVLRATELAFQRLRPSLRPVINATGVVIHTNLGRSLLPEEIFQTLTEIAGRYSNLEYNLQAGERGSRYSHVEGILRELTGAESALVVNNNAAAVLITLETLARGKEVVVSRGELVEIGGSFRIPDVMARSGAVLREVGATNRTHLKDYAMAIGEHTALLMKVHQSNFSIVGFTKSVSVKELSVLAHEHNLPLYEDLGSGNLVDLGAFGIVHEPTVQETMEAGADLVSFSGDKLLGGPQAGIIVGRRNLVDRIKRNPLNRALRIDKLTLATLEGVLRIYREPERAIKTIPTLHMLTTPIEEVRRKAERLFKRLHSLDLPFDLEIINTVSRVGGGAMPLQRIDSFAVSLEAGETRPSGSPRISTSRLEKALRQNEPAIIVRMEDEKIIMDLRTVQDNEIPMIADGIGMAVTRLEKTTHGN